VVNYNRLM